MNQTNISKGIFLGFLCFFCISLMQVTMKYLAPHFHMMQILTFRCFVICLLCIPFYYKAHKQILPRSNHFHLHVSRYLIISIGLIFEFMAIKILPLAEFTVLGFTSTFFIFFFSSIFLNERANFIRLLMIIIGFAGIIFIKNPSVENIDMNLGILYKLLGMLFISYGFIQNKKLAWWDQTITVVYIYALLGFVGYGAFLPFVWKTPTLDQLNLLILFGIIGFMINYLLTKSLSLAPSIVISPLKYFNLLWGVFWGYYIWNQMPGHYFWIGASLIIGSNLFLIYYDSKFDTQKRYTNTSKI